MTSGGSRKTLLAVIAAVGVLMYAVDLAYRGLLRDPLRADAKKADKLSKDIRQAKLSIAEAKHVARDLDELESRSLPYDLEFARSEYQAWLLKLANDASLETIQVDSGQPLLVSISGAKRRPQKAFHKLSFSVRGRGNVKQIVSFLYDFYEAGHLQKIEAVHINPVGKSDQLDMSLSIQVLALHTATRQSELSLARSSQLAHDELDAYECIVSRNLFGVRGNNQLAIAVQLTALTTNVHGVVEAWFTIRPNKETTVLRAGSLLANGPFEAKILSIDATTAIVEIDGAPLSIHVGQTLADGQPVRSNVAFNPQ